MNILKVYFQVKMTIRLFYKNNSLLTKKFDFTYANFLKIIFRILEYLTFKLIYWVN